MFANTCSQVRESIYGLLGLSQVGLNQINATLGTGFAVAPGVLVTAGHFVHVENNPAKPAHTRFEVIRAPDVGQQAENALLVAEDAIRDVAILRIATQPRSNSSVSLETRIVPVGTSCGSLGFPLATLIASQSGRQHTLVERFQSASVSAYARHVHPSGQPLNFYETDAHMYEGSSGCPGFLKDGWVFAMHVSSLTQEAAGGQGQGSTTRLAISRWVPADDIRAFARSKGVAI